MHGEGKLIMGNGIEVHLLREELANQAVHILVRAALPGSIGMNVQNEDLIYNQRKVILKIFLIIISVILSGCVAYPYPAYPGPDPYQAQALASEQCAKSGKVAVKIKPTNCNDTNCITAFECQ